MGVRYYESVRIFDGEALICATFSNKFLLLYTSDLSGDVELSDIQLRPEALVSQFSSRYVLYTIISINLYYL